MESSMQSDETADHPLALDAIGGAVVRRATRAGVAVTVTARLVEDSLARQEGRLGRRDRAQVIHDALSSA